MSIKVASSYAYVNVPIIAFESLMDKRRREATRAA